ncbi:MAG: TetR/AcrR family transcriptional regulator [Pedococcus sp.]
MNGVSMPYESHGRTGQKSRTRTALVTAAREMVANGQTPTVDRAAAAASVSRATAYRYFPNHGSLLAAAHPETGTQSLLGDDPPADPAARLDVVIRAFTTLIVETETQQRTMLRLSLEDHLEHTGDDHAPLPLRQGRAIGWITEALEPLRGQLTDEGLRRLVLAIRSATGIEALVWLTDMAGLSRDEAVDLMRESARALLSAGVAGPKVRV